MGFRGLTHPDYSTKEQSDGDETHTYHLLYKTCHSAHSAAAAEDYVGNE